MEKILERFLILILFMGCYPAGTGLGTGGEVLGPSNDGQPVAAAHYQPGAPEGEINLALEIWAPGATVEAVRIDNLVGPPYSWRSDLTDDGAGALTVTDLEGRVLANGSGSMNWGPMGDIDEMLRLSLTDNGLFRGRETDFQITVFLSGGTRVISLMPAPPEALDSISDPPDSAP